jgi:hypothetical protein
MVQDMSLQDMSLTSQTEGADKVVDPPMPAPEGDVLDTNDNSGDQAPVDAEAKPPPLPAPDPAPNPIDKQIEQGVPPEIDQTLQCSSCICHPKNHVLGPE